MKRGRRRVGEIERKKLREIRRDIKRENRKRKVMRER